MPELADQLDRLRGELSVREAQGKKLFSLLNSLGFPPASDSDYQELQRTIQSLSDEVKALDARLRRAYLEHAKLGCLSPPPDREESLRDTTKGDEQGETQSNQRRAA